MSIPAVLKGSLAAGVAAEYGEHFAVGAGFAEYFGEFGVFAVPERVDEKGVVPVHGLAGSLVDVGQVDVGAFEDVEHVDQ